MTGSEEGKSPAEILERLGTLLDESTLLREIDQPIEAALQQFHVSASQPLSTREFNAAIGDFVKHVYGEGLAVRRALSASQARAEAMMLLDAYYQGAQVRGYAGALVDATQPPPLGLGLILIRLAGIIAAAERQKYTAWVLARTLGPLSWPERCRVVEFLLQCFGRHLPQQLRLCPPEQLADDIPWLVASVLEVQKAIRQICG